MALRYRLLAFRMRPDERDTFIDQRCELGRLPAPSITLQRINVPPAS